MSYQPKTGQKCHCRPAVQRDNCPDCEGTGWAIDFRAIRARALERAKEREKQAAAGPSGALVNCPRCDGTLEEPGAPNWPEHGTALCSLCAGTGVGAPEKAEEYRQEEGE